jgi:hypothetical protein
MEAVFLRGGVTIATQPFERSLKEQARDALEAASGDIRRMPASLRPIAQRLIRDTARAVVKCRDVKAGRAPAEIVVFGERARTIRFYLAHTARTRRAVPRRRGAGRPRAQASRSSAKSGDSGEGGEPPAESDDADHLWRLEREFQPTVPASCCCDRPILWDRRRHCFRCGRDRQVVAA